MGKRTEYRVVGENEVGELWDSPQMANLAEVKREAARFRATGWNNYVRIQFRTVTESDWADLSDADPTP